MTRTITLIRRPGESVETWAKQIRIAQRGTYVNPSFMLEFFPELHWRENPVIHFFPFNPEEGSPLFQLTRRGLVQPTYEHALCYAANHKNGEEKILFYHEPVFLPHIKHWGGVVTVIVNSSGHRYICLPPADFSWEKGLWIAGVEPES